jgi:phosphatidylglycerophosphate synthase
VAGSAGLAYKAYEIEELVDVYFFRRLGYVVAHAARLVRLTPNAISMLAACVGVVGGALLYDRRYALIGCALLIFYGVVDSADGQLARMTHQTSELGRVLDGVSGYFMNAAIFVAIAFAAVDGGSGPSIFLWACLAGASVIVQAQMYEYHRMSYTRVAIHGAVGPPHGIEESARAGRPDWSATGGIVTSMLGRASHLYDVSQRKLAGAHPDVEEAIARRTTAGRVLDEDRARYRASFYRLVRGWNLLGDNVRRYAVCALVLLQHLEWYFAFILVPMNAVLLALWAAQHRADRRFLASI